MVRNGILYSDLVETSIEQYGKERDIKQLNENMKELGKIAIKVASTLNMENRTVMHMI